MQSRCSTPLPRSHEPPPPTTAAVLRAVLTPLVEAASKEACARRPPGAGGAAAPALAALRGAVNVRDGYGRTPLHLAAKEGHVDSIK